MKTHIIWIFVGVAAFVAGFQLAKQETPVVEKRIEVIKEVPKEVEKKVEVPAKIPEKYETALAVVERIHASKIVTGRDVLEGVKAVRVNVGIADDLKQTVSESDIRTKLEITLRRSGVPIDEKSDYWLSYTVNGFSRDSPTLVWSINTHLDVVVYAFREDGTVTKTICSIWDNGSYGTVGTSVARGALLGQAESDAEAFANDWLAMNAKQTAAYTQAVAANEAARDVREKAIATAARVTRGSYVPAARPAEQTRPAEPEAKIDLQKIKDAAEDRADTYFRYEYPAGSSATLSIDVHIDLEEPEPMSGWAGQYRVRGRGHLEFFDSAGISFSRVVREFEVVVITDGQGGIKSREFTLR